jgi:hypothetical protein
MSKKAKKSRQSDFVRLSPILDIVRAAIWTGVLDDEHPISVMLIAEQESAKTECLKFFAGTSTLTYLSDATGKGLASFKSKIEEKKLRHFVLLDLVRVLSHAKGVGERTIQQLATLMEEGESMTVDPSGQANWANFPRVGTLMGITPQYLQSKMIKWRATGFMTRFLPVSFRYTPSTVSAIHDAIQKGIKLPPAEPITFFKIVHVSLSAQRAKELREHAVNIAADVDINGFRWHRQMRALAKGRAASQGRTVVSPADVKQVREWGEFFKGKEVEL